MRDDKITMTGEVLDNNTGIFRVQVDGGMVICRPSGKIRQNKIHILPGDQVRIEVSPYDLSQGRIVTRL